jgi:hypothetical protein
MNRRTVIALIVVLALIAAACGDDGGADEGSDPAAEDATPTEEAPTVALVDYPNFDDEVLVEDQALLDELADLYAAGLDGADPEMERFLWGTLPIDVFDRMLTGEEVETGPLLWARHGSGYCGGRGLRGEIAEAQPDAALVGFSNPLTAAAQQATLDRATEALDARAAGGQELLDYARSSLFDTPPPAGDPEADPIQGLANLFGYNQGYMLEILETPPESLDTPEEYRVTCTPELFDCDYATAKLAGLPPLTERVAGLEGDAAWEALVDELAPIQAAGVPEGRSVWSVGLSVEGFPQQSYDQLLDVSSSFLETIQAAAIAAAAASADSDGDLAAISALTNAGLIVWLDAYFAGVQDGESEIELPTFA